MNYYAGMDVSLEETLICIVDKTGKRDSPAVHNPQSAHLEAVSRPQVPWLL